MRGLTMDELDGVNGGLLRAVVGNGSVLSHDNEVGFMQIQSVMSQRSQEVTMVTNMMQSLGDTNRNVASNIGK